MRDHVLDYRFSYRAEYVPVRKRLTRHAFLNGVEPVSILEIEATDAPVAFRISQQSGRCDAFEVRSHGDALWWPLFGLDGQVSGAEFFAHAKSDWDKACAILDPLARTYRFFGDTHEQRFEGQPLRSYESDFRDQLLSAQHDASRVRVIGGRVHVAGGEPVWYAVANDEGRRGFDLQLGHSDLDRKDRDAYWMPCPDRSPRMTSARLGRAFGLNELAHGIGWLAADVVRYRSKIVDEGIHRSVGAADLCVRAFAQHLWEIAFMRPDLRGILPVIAKATRNTPPPLVLPHKEMLERLASLDATRTQLLGSRIVDDARLLRDRVDEFRPVTVSDEEIDAISAALAEFA
ncbi:hypothetical protein [Tardiphaga sp.]|jgi:hypothetical protein|uniref:hypothetical protein n=1 Tax=Tardiphaga sp. TaxID=1926292 RepID=UPI0037DA06F3